eukprot:9080243-Pyramimonas_sp.AAC.1
MAQFARAHSGILGGLRRHLAAAAEEGQQPRGHFVHEADVRNEHQGKHEVEGGGLVDVHARVQAAQAREGGQRDVEEVHQADHPQKGAGPGDVVRAVVGPQNLRGRPAPTHTS